MTQSIRALLEHRQYQPRFEKAAAAVTNLSGCNWRLYCFQFAYLNQKMPPKKHSNIAHFFEFARRKTYLRFGSWLANRKVKRYVEKHLAPLIQEAKLATKSTGADVSDYVLLHSWIRFKKPKYVLECGSGLTTWIIADALRTNWIESGEKPDQKGLVVSMEEDQDWHTHAAEGCATRLRPFVEYLQSDREYFHYSFLFGVTYKTIPDYPYELMFVDGPVCRYYQDEETRETYEHTAALDLVKLLLRREDLKLTVLVDNLKRTQIAYSCLFRPNSLIYYKHLSNLGVMEEVTRADLSADTEQFLQTFKKIINKSSWNGTPSFFQNLE